MCLPRFKASVSDHCLSHITGNEIPNSVASGAGPGERNVPGEEAEDQEGAVSFGPAALGSLPETSECRSRGNCRETRDEYSLQNKSAFCFILYFLY